MNMIVNKSDLVGYEAVDRTTAKKEALAKLVAAWESKQAKNAARFGGMGFLAVSLAACNSSTDDPVAADDTGGATPETNLVTAFTGSLATTTDYITTDFTDQSDTITADATTLTAGDVLVDSTSTDSDTLNVTLAGGANAKVGTITGIENINFNNTSLTTDSAIDLDNIIGSAVTINHSANALVAPTGSAVTNLESGSSVTMGTNITGAVTVATSASATGTTISGGSSGTLTVTAGATNTNMSVTGGSTAGSTIVDVNSGTGASVTSGASDGTLTVTNLATSATLVMSKAGTTASASTANLSGAGSAAGDAASLSASGIITLLTNGTGNALDQVEALTVSGNGAAVTFNDSGAPTSLAMTGSQDITYVTTAARADAMTAITNSTTAGTQTIEVGAPGVDTDFSTIAADVININGAITAATTMTFLDAANIKLGAAQANAFTIDISDGSGTTTQAAGTINLDLAADVTSVITLDQTASSDNATTLNVTATVAQTALAIQDAGADGAQASTINLSGAVGVVVAGGANGTETAHLNAASMTGALDVTLDPSMLQITGGSGGDTFRGVAADGAYILAGGAGNDQYIVAANSANQSVVATGIEVIDVTAGTSDYAASQLHTGTFIIKDTSGGGQQMQIDAGATMDLATINLSGLSFQNAATNIQIGAGDAGATALTLSGALFNTAQAVNITGSATIDDITGTANADIISGGAGADVLNGAAGADTLDGGAGADTLNGGTGADNITTGAGADTISVAAGDAAAGAAGTASTTGLDTVSDFTAGTVASGGDKIQHGGGASTIAGDNATAVAGTAAIATGTATFHADDDTLAEKITATEAAMTGTTLGQAAMFAHGGAAYVLITDTTDGCTASDVLIALTGIDTTATTSDVLTADGAGGFTIV